MNSAKERVGLVASIIAIGTFLTGIQSVPQLLGRLAGHVDGPRVAISESNLPGTLVAAFLVLSYACYFALFFGVLRCAKRAWFRSVELNLYFLFGRFVFLLAFAICVAFTFPLLEAFVGPLEAETTRLMLTTFIHCPAVLTLSYMTVISGLEIGGRWSSITLG
jgi:hypothetical protein